MKLSLVSFLFLVVSFFTMPESALAQSTAANAPQPTSEQSLQDLVREVRQLRATLQRMNTAMYKGQVTIERLKLQQEHVFRIAREQRDTRENLSETRTQQNRLRQSIRSAEAGAEAGVKHPAEVAGMKSELASLREREHRFAMREAELTNELMLERAKLNELNNRLNELEVELAPK